MLGYLLCWLSWRFTSIADLNYSPLQSSYLYQQLWLTMPSSMEPFSRRRWATIPAPSVSNSVLEVIFFASAVSTSFLNLIYHGASKVDLLPILKFSMFRPRYQTQQIQNSQSSNFVQFGLFILEYGQKRDSYPGPVYLDTLITMLLIAKGFKSSH